MKKDTKRFNVVGSIFRGAAVVLVALALASLLLEQVAWMAHYWPVKQLVASRNSNVPLFIYQSGYKSDLDGDGETDFLSAYGCAFLSAASRSGAVVEPECSLSPLDSNTAATFAIWRPNADYQELYKSGLSEEETMYFSELPGQKYSPYETDHLEKLRFPLTVRAYLLAGTDIPTLVVEESNLEVTSFEITPEGKLEEVSPTVLARLRALLSVADISDSSGLFSVMIAWFFVSRIILLIAAGWFVVWCLSQLLKRGSNSSPRQK